MHNVLKIKPPLVFSSINADELVMLLEETMAETFIKSISL
jgi:4-aminobutyrate aminotransferase-like enzyme